MAGPLEGVRIIELAGIGPGPFCGMLLADLGAEVITVQRPGGNPLAATAREVLFRNRRNIIVDLKQPEGVDTILRMCESADAILEANRPGVAERLGLGPDKVLARNPQIVYGRMTGWGQSGPLSQAAGHDINFISLTGVLHAIGPKGGKPTLPLNLIGDFGGGGLMLAYGLVCGILRARTTGRGDVIDASIVDGSATLMAMTSGLRAAGTFSDQRGSNLIDGGAHFYTIYETLDNKYVAIGALEPQFYSLLREKLQLDDPAFDDQMSEEAWPELQEKLEIIFLSKTREEWDEILEGTDVCYSPVLDIGEAPTHPHNVARGTYLEIDGVTHPAPAPRFEHNAPSDPIPALPDGAHSLDILKSFQFKQDEIDALINIGAVGAHESR